MIHVSGTDDHDEKGILISDEHTNPGDPPQDAREADAQDGRACSRKLQPPVLEGPADAEVTLIGLGLHLERRSRRRRRSSPRRADDQPAPLQVPPSLPRARRPGRSSRAAGGRSSWRTTSRGQFARHLRAETGFTVDHVLTRYDGEPFEPAWIAASRPGLPRGPAGRPRGGGARGAGDGLPLHPHPHAGPDAPGPPPARWPAADTASPCGRWSSWAGRRASPRRCSSSAWTPGSIGCTRPATDPGAGRRR